MRSTFNRGDVANRAIQLAGLECGLFTERKEITHSAEFDRYEARS